MASNEQHLDPAGMSRASAFTVSKTIVVKAGPEGKKYTLHKKLLAFHSEYFRGALSGKFKETEDVVIPLDDVDVEVFDVFADWIYEKRIANDIYYRVSRGSLSIISRAYILADRILAQGFKSSVFNVIFSAYKRVPLWPRYPAMAFGFKNLPAKDPLLQLYIDAFVVNDAMKNYLEKRKAEVVSEISDIPHELATRLLVKLHETRRMSQEEKVLKRSDYDI